MNIEPALQTTSKGSAGQEDWRANPNESLTSGRVEFISFSIGEEQYGVDIMAVREIKGWTEITHLPKQPEYVRGVLNLRGVMVPIIDLRCRFGQGKTEATALHIVIVVQVEARLIGLLADRVLELGPDADETGPYRNFRLTHDSDGIAWLLFDRAGAFLVRPPPNG